MQPKKDSVLSLQTVAWTLFLLLFTVMPGRAAVEIREVVSKSGVTAWLVEDHAIPIVSMRFAFRGGSVHDPVGKEGMANLMVSLLDEGAGELDRAAFQDRVEETGIEMGFSAGIDVITGNVRVLRDDLSEGLDLLRLALGQPRFDQAPFDRIRAQMVVGIQSRALRPETEAERLWSNAIYGEHPYSRSDEGTAETLMAISREELASLHKQVITRENLVVGVVGAISPEELEQVLDQVFGELPETAQLGDIERVEPKLDQSLAVPFDLPQVSIRLAFAGLARDDPQFFAAYMMNHILGGGTFSSWLFEEVRERRGLTYGVGSSLVNRDYSEALMIGTSTRPDRANEAIEVIRAEVRRMIEDGPSPEELEAAKAYVVGAYAINNLDSSAAIARTLVQIQLDNLGMDYIDRRVNLIESVSVEDVRNAARRLLDVEPAIMIIGSVAAADVVIE